MAEMDVITGEGLPFNLTLNTPPQSAPALNVAIYGNPNLVNEIECLESNRIVKALKENKGIQQRAAKSLGLTPRQLGYRLKKYRINVKSI
jgi:Nif-specific regulatory protein